MPVEFTLIGDHREDASQFLVVGADGQYYRYDPAHEQLSAVELDDLWELSVNGDEGTAWELWTQD